MKKLFNYIKPYWKPALLAPLFMLLEVVTDLLQPTLLSSIVDRGIANNDINYIIITGLIMIGVAVLGLFGGTLCTIFASIASQSFGADLRYDLFKKIQSFSFDSLDKFKTASLITRLTNDVSQIQNIVLTMLRMMVRAPLLSIGGIIMTLLINPELATILLVTIPILILALSFVISKGFPIFNEVQQSVDKVNAVMRENLIGIRIVKAFVRSDYEIKRFDNANTALMNVTKKGAKLIGLTMPIMILLMNFSIIAVLWFGGIKVNNGNMQVGQIMAFISYMSQILFSLMMLSFMFMMFSRAKVSADRVIEVLDTKTNIVDSPNAADMPIKKGSVEFRNVTFKYEGASGDPVLKDISFSVKAGQTIALLGATGSGKSTLVNLIPRFYDAVSGQVLVDGIDVRNIKLETLRNAISIVLQESILFSGTIIDNIRWGKESATEEEVIEAAKLAQAHSFIANFPDGYNTQIGQRGVNLSGGQKQRISIARAILRKPPILILDDSTSAVDMATESHIQQGFKSALNNTTTFIIAQRISSVVEADKIIVLDDGKIVDIGNHQELFERCLVYQDIYRSQLGEEAI